MIIALVSCSQQKSAKVALLVQQYLFFLWGMDEKIFMVDSWL